jgi:hypothetical protein
MMQTRGQSFKKSIRFRFFRIPRFGWPVRERRDGSKTMQKRWDCDRRRRKISLKIQPAQAGKTRSTLSAACQASEPQSGKISRTSRLTAVKVRKMSSPAKTKRTSTSEGSRARQETSMTNTMSQK